MSVRWNFRQALFGFGDSYKRRKKPAKALRRAQFFEQLENRRVLNGIPIAKDDLTYVTAVNTALAVTSTNQIMLNDWDPEGSSNTASVVTNPANGTAQTSMVLRGHLLILPTQATPASIPSPTRSMTGRQTATL